MITKQFVTAGKSTFTVEVPANLHDANHKPHYTFRVEKSEANGNYAETYFVKLLTGTDNETDYTYVGILDVATGAIRLTKKSAYAIDSYPVRLLTRTLARVWKEEQQAIVNAGFKLHHEGRCGRCNRLLTTPDSIEYGIGPECRKMLEV